MSGERDRDGEPASSGEPDGWTEGDIDAAFAEIVARYGRTAPDVGPWPAAEDLDDPAPDAEKRLREGRSASAGPASGGASPERPGRSGPTSSRGTASTPPTTPPTDQPPTDQPPSDLPPTARPGTEGGADAGRGAAAAPSDESADPSSGARARHREPDGQDEPDPTSAEPVRPPTADHPVRYLPDEVQVDDDRFVPPEPLPIAPGDFVTSLAWVAVLGGPLVLIIAALAWRGIPGELVLAAVVAFIGGFVTLVARLPRERPDDPDDGAVV